jgi:hypothetical protein
MRDPLHEQGSPRRDHKPFRVRLPGFVGDEEIGLGEVIKRATAAVGLRPCGDCMRRAEALNRRLVVTGKRQY